MDVAGEKLAKALQNISQVQQQISHSQTQLEGLSNQLSLLSNFSALPNMGRTGNDLPIASLITRLNDLAPEIQNSTRGAEQAINRVRENQG